MHYAVRRLLLAFQTSTSFALANCYHGDYKWHAFAFRHICTFQANRDGAIISDNLIWLNESSSRLHTKNRKIGLPTKYD